LEQLQFLFFKIPFTANAPGNLSMTSGTLPMMSGTRLNVYEQSAAGAQKPMRTARQEDGTALEQAATENGVRPTALTISVSGAHNQCFRLFL
jgi:hypothetical protein